MQTAVRTQAPPPQKLSSAVADRERILRGSWARPLQESWEIFLWPPLNSSEIHRYLFYWIVLEGEERSGLTRARSYRP
jgi:hypothetical protein